MSAAAGAAVDPELVSELGITLTDVLSAMLEQDAERTLHAMTSGPAVVARLAIHDQATGGCTGVELQMGLGLARVLASRMMMMADPADDEIIDAVAELGNIAAGAAKSLMFSHARLSLPATQIVDSIAPVPDSGRVRFTVRAMVMGHVAQLSVVGDVDENELQWPPVVASDFLGRPS